MDNSRNPSFAVITALVLAAAIFPMPSHADGECLGWNVTGPWTISQSNGTTVRMNLEQNGTHLQGVGEYSYYNNDNHKVQTIGGPVDGYLEQGNLVRVTAYWSNSSAGMYTGQVEADGSMNGFAVDKNDPGNKATFRANGVPQCTSRAAVAPATPARPALALGRVRLPAGTTNAPARTMCEMAASARARNSPAAPGLERRCLAEGGSKPVALGRVLPPTPTPVPPAMPPADSEPPATPPATPVPKTPPSPGLPATNPDQLDALAAKGAEIAGIDPIVEAVRSAVTGMYYQIGFDIATGLFGDPILGTEGKTKMDAVTSSIRDSLSATGRRGFDASMEFHFARKY
ncbi:hypothetical protein BH11PSE14_BH11PSE14_09120 [soil metagenome]